MIFQVALSVLFFLEALSVSSTVVGSELMSSEDSGSGLIISCSIGGGRLRIFTNCRAYTSLTVSGFVTRFSDWYLRVGFLTNNCFCNLV
jgi:hypothetical protein